MKSRTEKVRSTVSSLHNAQEQLSALMEGYLSEYANHMIWEDSIEFIRLQEKDLVYDEGLISQGFSWLIKGQRARIPDSVFENLAGNAYVLIGKHFFHFDKARAKVTQIPIDEKKRKALEALYEDPSNEFNRADMEKITDYTFPHPVRAIETTDPLQVQLSKHAMLALQDLEDVIKNTSQLADTFSRSAEIKAAPDSSAKEKKELSTSGNQRVSLSEQSGSNTTVSAYESLKETISAILDPHALGSLLEKIPTSNVTDGPDAPTSLVGEVGKLGLEMTSTVVDRIPGLRRALNLAKPLHPTGVRMLFSPLFPASVAGYKLYLSGRWYASMAQRAVAAGPAAKEHIHELVDGVFQPLLQLSSHCNAIHEIAMQVHLPSEAINQLKDMREQLAALVARAIADPATAQASLKANLVNYSGLFSDLMKNYFIDTPVLAFSEAAQVAKKPVALEEKAEEKKSTPGMRTLFRHFVSTRKTLTEEQQALLAKTQAALSSSQSYQDKDEDGYYRYLSADQETPVSQNMKAIANTCLALERLGELYSADASTASRLKALAHGKKAFDHFMKVNWNAAVDLGPDYEELLNTLLRQGMQAVTPGLERLAEVSHDIELTHHLRFGSLLEGLRPLFNELERLYYARGLTDVANPCGYTQQEEKSLQVKLSDAVVQAPWVRSQYVTVTHVLTELQWYEQHGNDVGKPDDGWRKLSSDENIAEFEGKISFLLEVLAKFKTEGVFKTASELDAFNQLMDDLMSRISRENQKKLIDDLHEGDQSEASLLLLKKLKLKGTTEEQEEKSKETNEEKRDLSHMEAVTEKVYHLRKKEQNRKKIAKVWPPQSLTIVLESVKRVKHHLSDQLLAVEKYQEALLEQKRTIVRSLKDENIISLLDAIKEGKQDPKLNRREKYKLAVLLADLGMGDREANLKDAHATAIQFISNADAIKELINAVAHIDSDFAHSLTVETFLAGYTEEPNVNLFPTKDEHVVRQDLIDVLDQLQPERVLELLEEMTLKPAQPVIRERAALLLSLFTTHHKPEIESGPEAADNILEQIGFSKIALIRLIIRRYQHASAKHDSEIQSKIGLFLGRLMSADPELAAMVFSSADKDKHDDYDVMRYKQAHEIIRKECLAKTTPAERAFYGEALVNTLSLNVSEMESYEEFLVSNRSAICALYKVVHPDITSDDEIMAHYLTGENTWALHELIEEFSKATVRPNSEAEKKLNAFYSALIRYRGKELVVEPTNIVTEKLTAMRRQLEQTIKHLFSDYANKIFIWDAEEKRVKSIVHTDPVAIKMSKHCLRILEKAEKISLQVHYLVSEIQKNNTKWGVIAGSVLDINVTAQELLEHVILLSALAKESGAHAEIITKLNGLREAVQSLPKQINQSPAQAQSLLGAVFQDLDDTLTNLARPYVRLHRPAATKKKYKTPIVELALVEARPLTYEPFPPDSYVLIRNHERWELRFLDHENKPEIVDLSDIRVGLQDILKKKKSIKEFSPFELEEIKKKLAERRLTVQGKEEQFRLIEPVRTAMYGLKELHDFLGQFEQYAADHQIQLDSAQIKTISETRVALTDAKQDADGYYIYNDTDTPFSQSVKALYNLSWGVNELSRNFSAHSAVVAAAQAPANIAKIANHIRHLEVLALEEHAGVLADQLKNVLLIYGKDIIFPPLVEMASVMHNTELTYDLRIGILSESLRPLFDPLEKIYLAQGLSTTANPFGYHPAIEETLKVKMDEAEDEGNTQDTKKYQDACGQYQMLRSEFALRSLQSEGLITFIEAVKQGGSEDKLNSGHKRQLAILLADIDLENREDALMNAHRKATNFVKSPRKIKEFILKVADLNPALGHMLAIESMLAGYVVFEFDHPVFLDYDANVQKNLVNALDRLEPKQALAMFESKGQSPAASLFIALLKDEKPYEQSRLYLDNISKEEWVGLIADRYQKLRHDLTAREAMENKMHNPKWQSTQPERELMNKLGLFLGSVARADAKIAQIVFSNPAHVAIVKDECLNQHAGGKIKSDSGLYYEAMVQAFSFSKEQKPALIHDFIKQNLAAIVEIHQTFSSSDVVMMDANDVIDLYTAGPVMLLPRLEEFVNKTSVGSAAEKKISEFASRFILCADNDEVRLEIVRQQRKAYGSKAARFLELLTPDASATFWQLVRQDLSVRQRTLNPELEKKLESIMQKAKSCSPQEQKELGAAIDKFKSAQEKSIAELASLTKSKMDIAGCRTAAQNLQSIEDVINKQCKEWEEQVNRDFRPNKFWLLCQQLEDMDGRLEKKGQGRLTGHHFRFLQNKIKFNAQSKPGWNALMVEVRKAANDSRFAVNDSEYAKYAERAIDVLTHLDQVDAGSSKLSRAKKVISKTLSPRASTSSSPIKKVTVQIQAALDEHNHKQLVKAQGSRRSSSELHFKESVESRDSKNPAAEIKKPLGKTS